ncbi:ABC transporter ATP-binding protein [Paenibacillus spongiae]|uniref:ABC transporter ATP-binding protein/permease n=1 Tax=Paenibacillus spongiae TaxID=2909671 RepID=A0ABY5SCE5_9BACL|nr:ABC transporter ATP-binding protein [Paenibacillus spongiae]UVI31621.1 ABC transporter ATP-binding protein/permease [Paenibacillus spongiae]
MAQIIFYLKKLHAFAGAKLYITLTGMIVISFLEGIGIYLLIPMLGLIGVFDVSHADVPFLSGLISRLDQIPERYNVPIVLAAYLVLIIGQALLQRNQAIMNIKMQQGFIRYLRLETYQSLLQANWKFYLSKRKSDFNHILTSELARVAQGTHLFLRLATSLVFTVVQLSFAFWISVKLTLVVMISGALLALFSRRFIKHAKTLGDRTTALSQQYFAGVTEQFNGIKDIKSNRLEHSHMAWFRSLCSRMEHNIVQLTKLQSTTQFFYSSTAAVLIVLFVFLSLNVFVVRPEQLMLIIIIFARLWPRFTGIQNSLEQITTTIPAFNSLLAMQRECEEAREQELLSDGSKEAAIRVVKGIECRSVYFRYNPDQAVYALKGINLRIPANGMTAIVGKSGAGKSTLIDMLMGMILPEKGEVIVDGELLTREKILALRHSISYVSQDPFLFNMSIRENMMMVEPDASEEQLWEALTQSASDAFVRALPQGLDTTIGDRGIRLSGGERQRIVLARAILRKPSILVLDEATSALDTENEAVVQKTLERLKGSMTVIVIAHRLSTIRNADQVIVMEQGEIIQSGGYQQLLRETRGTFSKLLAYQGLVNEG